MDTFQIDPEAKPPIQLIKNIDDYGNPFYIGKLQFPGKLEFECGASFFVFVSEEGYEELQIAPLDPRRRKKTRRDGVTMTSGRFTIDLEPMMDRNGQTYYVGEAIGLGKLDLRRGIFFTIFLSKPGREEIQIKRLDHKPKKRRAYSSRDVPVENVEKRWPPRIEEAVG
jgi:hypothetical protein